MVTGAKSLCCGHCLAEPRKRGRELRSGSWPSFFAHCGRMTNPAPTYVPRWMRNFSSMTFQSSRAGLPITYLPIGDTTKSASCNPAMLALFDNRVRLTIRLLMSAARMMPVPLTFRFNHARSSCRSNVGFRFSAMIWPPSSWFSISKQNRSTRISRLRR